MRRGHKRYFMMYDSDEVVCQSTTHIYGNASTVKTAKAYIGKCRKAMAKHNPRNFRIFDSDADIDPATDYVPCVYQED